ncbi:hypothetical protein NQ318_001199 [Aromia moschata]|uniref:N-acetyltransferase domain-containing protein n=1 Tax=Aromia moschata TaxID=1265417 RepID=A0AAV8ZFU8_9CUCU|nr:hypothetical protein NQ318_001199 [Aromia moschata]
MDIELLTNDKNIIFIYVIFVGVVQDFSSLFSVDPFSVSCFAGAVGGAFGWGGMELSVVPLHNHPEYMMDCCRLINEEWKRSDTARLHSLQNSCDKLPTSLILLQGKNLIGHLKLSVIPSIKEACFVESVVIATSLRGKGYGTIFMRNAEEYCKKLNLSAIYLSTKGQEQFYSKLGYTECPPISIYGSYIPKSIAPQNVCNKQKDDTVKHVPPPPPLPISTTLKTKKTFMVKQLSSSATVTKI